MKHQRGMTLIEVMISLAIMSFLAVFTGNSIRNALSGKKRIQNNIDIHATLRDALKVMERDINLAFQFRDPNITLHNFAVDERQKRAQQNRTQNPGAPPSGPVATVPGMAPQEGEAMQKKRVQVLTHFVGEKNTISFSSLSNVRMRANDQTSSIAEIGYSLKNCRKRSSQAKASSCLWRRVSPIIGTDVTKDGAETVLLENVETFEMRYLGPGRPDEWVDFWASNERGDDTTKLKFPYAVEITLAISDPSVKDGQKKKVLKVTQIAAIRNNGNADPKKPAQDGQIPQEGTPEVPVDEFNQPVQNPVGGVGR